MWNFKGTLWNSTQNILPIHWKVRFLYNIEILRALRFKSSYAFLKRPPGLAHTVGSLCSLVPFSGRMRNFLLTVRSNTFHCIDICCSTHGILFFLYRSTDRWRWKRTASRLEIGRCPPRARRRRTAHRWTTSWWSHCTISRSPPSRPLTWALPCPHTWVTWPAEVLVAPSCPRRVHHLTTTITAPAASPALGSAAASRWAVTTTWARSTRPHCPLPSLRRSPVSGPRGWTSAPTPVWSVLWHEIPPGSSKTK